MINKKDSGKALELMDMFMEQIVLMASRVYPKKHTHKKHYIIILSTAISKQKAMGKDPAK